MIQSSNTNVTNSYTFDGNGRVSARGVAMGGVNYLFRYSYDLAGDLTQEVYPSGRTVNYTYDMAQRPLTVNGVSAGVTTNYVQSSGYFPRGAPQYWQYGNGLLNWQSVNKVLASQEAWATQNNNGNNWMFVAYHGYDNSEKRERHCSTAKYETDLLGYHIVHCFGVCNHFCTATPRWAWPSVCFVLVCSAHELGSSDDRDRDL